MDDLPRRRPAFEDPDQAAIGELAGHHHGRELDHADAGDGGDAQGRHAAGHQAGVVLEPDSSPVGSEQVPAVTILRPAEGQAGHVGQVARHLGATVLCQ